MLLFYLELSLCRILFCQILLFIGPLFDFINLFLTKHLFSILWPILYLICVNVFWKCLTFDDIWTQSLPYFCICTLTSTWGIWYKTGLTSMRMQHWTLESSYLNRYCSITHCDLRQIHSYIFCHKILLAFFLVIFPSLAYLYDLVTDVSLFTRLFKNDILVLNQFQCLKKT